MSGYQLKTFSIGEDDLSEWDLERLSKPHAVDYVVYNYKIDGFEGSGFAIWRDREKFGYSYLGHCSCNGPLEDAGGADFTLEELRKLNSSEFNEYGKSVLKKVEELEDL